MSDWVALGNPPEPEDIPMTDAGNEAGGMFDTMLSEIDADWPNVDSEDPFMFQAGDEQENYIDPALFAKSLGLPDFYSARPAVSASGTPQDQAVNPLAITSSPIYPAEPVAVSTPSLQQASNNAALLNSSPPSAALPTPTRRDRGHYGSARRRTAESNNLQAIAPSLRRETLQSDPYTFEPIPEHQQGIVSPGLFSENVPEFRPRGSDMEVSNLNYDNSFNVLGDLGSASLMADHEVLEGAVGGYNSQAMQPTQQMAQIQDALQHPNQFPVIPVVTNGNVAPNHLPSYNPFSVLSNENGATDLNAFPTYVPAPVTAPILANANGSVAANTVAPWVSGLSIPADVDPERRAKMAEIASVAHMLLTPQDTLRGAQKVKLMQAAVAADEAMKKKATKRGKRNNAKKTQAPVPPAPANQPSSVNQLASTNQPASSKSTSKARGRKASSSVNPTNKEHIAPLWRGRHDRPGNELQALFLCQGSMVQFRPGDGLWNPTEAESRSNRYGDELPDEHPKLSQDTPEQPLPHSEMIVYSEVMTQKYVERPVYSGQVVIVSYDMKSDWWKKINIWAWQRYPVARCLDDVVVVITPFHIIFGRIPLDKDIANLKRDWRDMIGLVDELFKAPVTGASEPTWAAMYRLLPGFAFDHDQVDNSRAKINPVRTNLLDDLGFEAVYHQRFKQSEYYVPPVGDLFTPHEFCIRVGHFGKAGQHDRLHVQVTDVAGTRVIHD